MLYTIRLEQMEFRAYHGCYDLEQQVGNRFVVELAITTPLGAVADEDAVEKAVNYLTVYEKVREVMRVKCRTIECVAQNIIAAVRGSEVGPATRRQGGTCECNTKRIIKKSSFP